MHLLQKRLILVVFLKGFKIPARVVIDKIVLDVLGFGDDEINRILDYLYSALASEIQQPINPNARIIHNKQ
jgi:hypothetical protein